MRISDFRIADQYPSMIFFENELKKTSLAAAKKASYKGCSVTSL